jgi:hypothetical protein
MEGLELSSPSKGFLLLSNPARSCALGNLLAPILPAKLWLGPHPNGKECLLPAITIIPRAPE